jgi:vesicle-associated membrane protein-associated protein A
VRPNSGRVEPGQEVEVQGTFSQGQLIVVLLQAMKTDIPMDMKCKDKFLLQSTKITNDSAEANLSDLVLSHHCTQLTKVVTN